MRITTTSLPIWKDRVEYEQWMVRYRLARVAAQEIEARKCHCHVCKELWQS